MCKQLSRRNSNRSSSEAQNLPSLHFKYLALFWTTHICQTSAKQREREGEKKGRFLPQLREEATRESYKEWKQAVQRIVSKDRHRLDKLFHIFF